MTEPTKKSNFSGLVCQYVIFEAYVEEEYNAMVTIKISFN
jgi:hypothetical protein